MNFVTPTIFITAAGNSRRFGNGALKQLLPINGEPLIRRMIRQIREISPEAQIHILTYHEDLKFPDVHVIDTKSRPPELADTILLSEPCWSAFIVNLTTLRQFDSPFYPLLRPFRDFFCCHFIDPKSDWLPDPPVTLRYVNDYLTTDIDNWDEYYTVIQRGVPR